ncbi:transcription termination factor Rho [Actinomyces minihominis]|uniref:transcription termination factor Rho n=1 Tax=Actinomyces minihominis TaxID=2002838 RepID=UPI0035220744
MKLAELQALAAQRGIKGTSRMRKAQIIEAISGSTASQSAPAEKSAPAAESQPKSAPRSADETPAQTRSPRRAERSQKPAESVTDAVNAALDVRAAVAEDLAETRGRRGRQGQDGQQRRDGGRQDTSSSDREVPASGSDHAVGSLDEIALPEGGEAGRNRNRRDRNSRRRGRDRNQGPSQGQGQQRQDRNERSQAREEAPETGDDTALIPIAGIVDIQSNHAFVRTSGYLPGPNDVYVTLGNARRWGLRRGDAVVGAVRPARQTSDRGGRGNQNQKHNALVRVDSVNGMTIEQAMERREFGKLTPEYPREQLRMETTPKALTSRMIDMVAPIGKGQRGLIVSPPKAGKTMIIQQIAKAIEINNPNVHLMVVLVDERPEEVTDMRSIVKGEVIASTFDRPASDHTTVAELAIERAKRLVELGQDVVVLLDSITRLSRAYNLAAPASGRILSGGVDAAALYPPKKFFGAARNLREGGSLTIIASALVETGSKMDEVIFEEFKGTGNMELRLSRQLADRRIFPAIDINASGTRREELLLKPEELAIMWKLRRALGSLDQAQALETVLGKLKETSSNAEFLMLVSRTTSGD